MNVVIAGGGIAGNILLRQLQKRDDIVKLRAFERRSIEEVTPPGLHILMNHNVLNVIRDIEPELFKEFQDIGSDVHNWSVRTVSGDILYRSDSERETGHAAVTALIARWNLIHEATKCDELTEYNAEVVQLQEQLDTNTLNVLVRREIANGQTEDEWITGIDMLIAADGSCSTIRQQLAPSSSYYGPTFVTDFQIVAKGVDTSLLANNDIIRWVYNNAKQASFDDETNPNTKTVASEGCVRVAMMKLEEDTIGIFGNLAVSDVAVSDIEMDGGVLSSEVLVKLFYDEAPDALGSLLLSTLHDYGDSANWDQKQEAATCYEALDSKVLFIGDAAGAICSSLVGQGTNLALEDAIVAAVCFPNVRMISQLRQPRREFIRELSRRHVEEEITRWTDLSSDWRSSLQRLWSGEPLALQAVTATVENVQQYGQLIGESIDGGMYSPLTDAVLDLSNGTPRLYLMKLTGGRPLEVHQITCHKSVTQCLGALGTDHDFYLVMHPPSQNPSIGGLQAFRIPPRHFFKLNAGTWHAGPLWQGPDADRTFYNLELADTNSVDHTTIKLSDMMPGSSSDKLLIPVLPASMPNSEKMVGGP
jgi:2-polyprenyl-6-methoxyphenol hydroxylase-like FAD-dependent oxidoreductase